MEVYTFNCTYSRVKRIEEGLIFITPFDAMVRTTGNSQPFNPTCKLNTFGLFQHEVNIIDEERDPEGIKLKAGERYFTDLDIYTFCQKKSSPEMPGGLRFKNLNHGLLVETTGHSILNRGAFYLHEVVILEGPSTGDRHFVDLDCYTPTKSETEPTYTPPAEQIIPG